MTIAVIIGAGVLVISGFVVMRASERAMLISQIQSLSVPKRVAWDELFGDEPESALGARTHSLGCVTISIPEGIVEVSESTAGWGGRPANPSVTIQARWGQLDITRRVRSSYDRLRSDFEAEQTINGELRSSSTGELRKQFASAQEQQYYRDFDTCAIGPDRVALAGIGRLFVCVASPSDNYEYAFMFNYDVASTVDWRAVGESIRIDQGDCNGSLSDDVAAMRRSIVGP
jgi:hypothetical protein